MHGPAGGGTLLEVAVDDQVGVGIIVATLVTAGGSHLGDGQVVDIEVHSGALILEFEVDGAVLAVTAGIDGHLNVGPLGGDVERGVEVVIAVPSGILEGQEHTAGGAGLSLELDDVVHTGLDGGDGDGGGAPAAGGRPLIAVAAIGTLSHNATGVEADLAVVPVLVQDSLGVGLAVIGLDSLDLLLDLDVVEVDGGVGPVALQTDVHLGVATGVELEGVGLPLGRAGVFKLVRRSNQTTKPVVGTDQSLNRILGVGSQVIKGHHVIGVGLHSEGSSVGHKGVLTVGDGLLQSVVATVGVSNRGSGNFDGSVGSVAGVPSTQAALEVSAVHNVIVSRRNAHHSAQGQNGAQHN